MVLAKEVSPHFIALKGQSGFSEFRLKAFLEKINVIFPQIESLTCSEVYFLSLNEQIELLEESFKERINTILKAKDYEDQIENNQFFLIPRLGTISPWSSKATEILSNAGIGSLNRVEKGLCFSLKTSTKLDGSTLKKIGTNVYDRMTQSIILSIAEAEKIFIQVSSIPAELVPILEKGKDSLVEANNTLGLALNEDEINYLYESYTKRNSDLTDAELMMFAQVNSEHCRHKIFNAKWKVDGREYPLSLFEMIRNTFKENNKGVLSAYKDNAAVLLGHKAHRFYPDAVTSIYKSKLEEVNIVTKVETHNHPTAISPFPGASTGSGGEIRDEGATGRGAKPKAGFCGFSVSNLRIPGHEEDWEKDENKPDRIASPLQIMLEAPLGAAAFNNEFGRPNILGYFRSFEMHKGQNAYGYHKPIMLAGGIGNIKTSHIEKAEVPIGSQLIVLGGPAMSIGLGGGTASSLLSGEADLDLDFASVQRDNAEMERRCQEVLDKCWQKEEHNPILFIHDVGAGGLSNAVSELIRDSGHGGYINLRSISIAETGMSPKEIWCNESQERYVLAVEKNLLEDFLGICARERCPVSLIGEIIDGPDLKVYDKLFDNYPIDISLDILFGKTPQSLRSFDTKTKEEEVIELESLELESLIKKVLRHPTVASKNFLVTIGDRTVTGLVSRDQMVGPWQVPVADNAVTLSSFFSNVGESMALGEKTPCAVLDSASAARMAVGEAITNILSSGIENLSDVKLSANWMGAPDKLEGNQELFEAVKAVGMDLCPKWGICIPVGKDSLSMATSWIDESEQEQSVISPVSLIISAFAPLENISFALTPQINLRDSKPTELLFIDLAKGKKRMGGCIASQVTNQLAGPVPDVECVEEMPKLVNILFKLIRQKKILSYHDRSDGGLFCTLIEMAFAGRCGLNINLDEICNSDEEIIQTLFNEELGIVIQVNSEYKNEIKDLLSEAGLERNIFCIGSPDTSMDIKLSKNLEIKYEWSLEKFLKEWTTVSYRIQSLRDNPDTAKEEYLFDTDIKRKGLKPKVTFLIPKKIKRTKKKPPIAILREQGVNGHVEMAAAFDRAGFSCSDIHMTDLISGKQSLNKYRGLVACGGFSYGDVLGAGEGWATSILYNKGLRKDFKDFFAREDVFTLGVCNGCQMLAILSNLISPSTSWPRFVRNKSEKFEARVVQLLVKNSPSIFFSDMSQSVLPIAVAHGEGLISLSKEQTNKLIKQGLVPVMYADDEGQATESYPQNPNGSASGIAGVTNESGTITLMMPHPERSFLSMQNSWKPDDWGEYSPWIKFFLNARDFIN